MTRACLAVVAVMCAGGSPQTAEPPPAAAPVPAPAPAGPAEKRAQPPDAAGPQAPPAEPQLPPEPEPVVEHVIGPTPGAPTLTLGAAVAIALERNFALLDSADAVAGSKWQEKAALGPFLPRLSPVYQRSEDRTVWGFDLSEALPWSGATATATGRHTSQPLSEGPFPRTTELRLVLSQPLLRGFGPNATFFDLRNARRARVGQERGHTLARQRIAIDVARAFYDVIAYRQLLDVARQSLDRTQALQRSSEARLQVGMASKLDVFRAQLQAQQAREAMVRSEAALASALERFRATLALAPGDTVEPEAATLPKADVSDLEPLEVLVRRALETRLEMAEARDQVGDARRAASLARQKLLPQLDLNLGVTQLGLGGSFSEAWTNGVRDRRVELFLSASYPLQQYAERATSAIARIQVAGRERAVRQREIEVEQEVRQAVRDLEQIAKSVELQQQGVEVAAQQRRLAVLRYQRGLGSNFDVTDAEASLVTARSALVQLLTAWVVARLELERTTGTLDVVKEFAR